ncbi:MAG: hypothetical protein EOP49_21520 [Sphingobacteriales bacterium]|nr:MAG: hypothetical protein EOP49_21520 [Sphingobacteriales bacterium]
MLGLFFPFLVVVHIVFLVGWLLAKSKWAVLSLLVLLIGISEISALIGTNFSESYTLKKSDSTIRIMSWNVHQFGFFEGHKEGLVTRRLMLDFIKEQNPDIICMQEFIRDDPRKLDHVSVFQLFKNLGYPYVFHSEDYIQSDGRYAMGVAIASKLPITDSFRIRYQGTTASMSAESLLAADIMWHNKPIRIFTTHLQSNQLAQKEYVHVTSRSGDASKIVGTSKTIVRKLKVAYQYRGEQADKVAAALDASPHPEIITGDFNDIPNSYTYRTVLKNRQDAFHEKGWGLSRTFSHISPTLRIDYIMADRQFEVLQYARHLLPYSDHYPIIADLKLIER